jgi:hypothetical protein
MKMKRQLLSFDIQHLFEIIRNVTEIHLQNRFFSGNVAGGNSANSNEEASAYIHSTRK